MPIIDSFNLGCMAPFSIFSHSINLRYYKQYLVQIHFPQLLNPNFKIKTDCLGLSEELFFLGLLLPKMKVSVINLLLLHFFELVLISRC